MHYSAKHGLVIACRLSVRLSVCDVGGLLPNKYVGTNVRTYEFTVDKSEQGVLPPQ